MCTLHNLFLMINWVQKVLVAASKFLDIFKTLSLFIVYVLCVSGYAIRVNCRLAMLLKGLSALALMAQLHAMFLLKRWHKHQAGRIWAFVNFARPHLGSLDFFLLFFFDQFLTWCLKSHWLEVLRMFYVALRLILSLLTEKFVFHPAPTVLTGVCELVDALSIYAVVMKSLSVTIKNLENFLF